MCSSLRTKRAVCITKSLRSTYKNPDQIAHKVLADRIAKRDPGNKPKSGDRIPYVYIVNPDKKAKQGVSEGAKNLATLADKYKAKVTFCVCPEVVDAFPKNLNHEIGLHIHPGWEELKYGKYSWFVGDEYLKENCQQSSNSTALCDFPYEEQLDMISRGKSLLENHFNKTVRVFTAGRWSVNNDTIKALINQGP